MMKDYHKDIINFTLGKSSIVNYFCNILRQTSPICKQIETERLY